MATHGGCIIFNGMFIGARVLNGRVDIYDIKTGFTVPNIQRYEISYDCQCRDIMAVKSVTFLCYMGFSEAGQSFSLTVTADRVEVVEG